MNYYKQKQHNVWHLEQLATFKKSELFLQSEAFALEGQKTLVWLGNNGSVRMDAAVEPETFLNAITTWKDWQQNNYSEKEEFKYNSWIESQKEMFKETDEYKKSELARFVYSAAYDGSELPHFDGIEVYENGTIELCTNEKFENAVKPLKEFEMYNYYEVKKRHEYVNEQVALFKKSDIFLQSEAFKIEGEKTLVLVTRDDGSVVLDAASPAEKFSNAIMPWEDWKENNYSEKEECAYNTMIEERKKNSPDQIFLKEESHHQQENKECCMSM